MLEKCCRKSLMTRLSSPLTGFFYWTDAVKLILCKWHPDKKGSTTSTKTGFGPHRPAPSLWHKNSGVAWFSFLLGEVCVSAAKFSLSVCISLTLVKLTILLYGARQWLSPCPCLPQAGTDPPQLCHHEADRTPLGAHREVTVQASTTQLHYLPLAVPGAQCTCSTNSSQAELTRNKKQEKGQTILLLLQTEKFCDLPHRAGKSAVWAYAGKRQLWLLLQALLSVSLSLEHVTLTTSGTAPQGCEAGCPFGQDRLSWRQNPFLKELHSGGERDHLLTWACLAASLQD